MLHTVSRNDTAFGTCCRLCLLLGGKSFYCSIASQLAERSRLRAEQCKEARHRSWMPDALSANVFCVAVGVHCCLKIGLHWAVLHWAGGESGWQILLRGFAEEVDAASHASHCWWHVRASAGQRTGAPCLETVQLLHQETPQFISSDLWPPDSVNLILVDYRIWG